MEGRSNIYGREGYVSGMGYKRQTKGGHNIIIIRIYVVTDGELKGETHTGTGDEMPHLRSLPRLLMDAQRKRSNRRLVTTLVTLPL